MREEQYKICKERGHTADPRRTNYPEWKICKFCYVGFRIVEMVEEAPKDLMVSIPV